MSRQSMLPECCKNQMPCCKSGRMVPGVPKVASLSRLQPPRTIVGPVGVPGPSGIRAPSARASVEEFAPPPPPMSRLQAPRRVTAPPDYPIAPPAHPASQAPPTRLAPRSGKPCQPCQPRNAPSSSQAQYGYHRQGMPPQAPRGYPARSLQPPQYYQRPPAAGTAGTQRALMIGMSRPPMAAVSKTVTTELNKPHPRGGVATARVVSKTTFTGNTGRAAKETVAVETSRQIGRPSSRGSRPPSREASRPTSREAGRPKGIPQPSRLQRFDKTVSAELTRRKAIATVATTTTSDTNLLEAVDRLAKAEAAHTFAGAVAAAEAAAAAAPDAIAAEEAAAEGARCYQAEIVDVVSEDVPGEKPIQIIGYVGITRPKYAAR